jgi:hypothetical protein
MEEKDNNLKEKQFVLIKEFNHYSCLVFELENNHYARC